MPRNRTAITIDAELLEEVAKEAARRGTSVDATIDDLLALMLLELEMGRAEGEEPDA